MDRRRVRRTAAEGTPIQDPDTSKGETEVVIVETDAAHRDYDPQLAGIWQLAERRFADRIPFPRAHRFAKDVLDRDFVTIRIEPPGASRWHFEVMVSRAAHIEVRRDAVDADSRSPATMSKVRLPQPDTSIDIVGMDLPPDVDVASWLDEWLEQVGMLPHSSRPIRTDRGVMGDVVATRHADAGLQVARYTTVRFGERTFLLVLRSPMATYRLVAREFVLAVASLRPAVGHSVDGLERERAGGADDGRAAQQP